MDWDDSIFDYCERQSDDFWAEPVNALTNAAFLVAAGAAFLLWRRRAEASARADYPALALILVMALVGVGSFIFHTVATRRAMLLDVIPIAVFIYGYFDLALRRFFSLRAPAALALTIFFGLFSYAIDETVHGLNGSAGYLPALFAMAVFAALLWWRRDAASRRTAHGLATAALAFIASLVFRTVDRAICADIPFGTHFLWHILNALVLYLLLRVAINYATPSEKA